MIDPFDKEALMDRMDGDVEFLAETLELLQEEGPVLLAELRAAASEQNSERLVSAAHMLKGMVSNFCAEPSALAAKHLEEMGRSGILKGVDEAVAAVVKETERLKAGLDDLLKALRT